jgi:hypothetical protein
MGRINIRGESLNSCPQREFHFPLRQEGLVMYRRRGYLLKAALCAAALLSFSAPLLAGDRVHSGDRLASGSVPAPSITVRAAPLRVVSVLVTLPGAAPAAEAFYVNLREPDGQVRRFPVEGGRAAIQFRQVYLRPGESLAIHWTPAK